MLKANKMKQTFQNKTDISKQSLPIMMMIIYWTLMGILLLQQIKTTDAAKYKGDGCETKSKPGICKAWSECPVIKTLIDRGEYNNREVVNCGFGVKEELICCPVLRTEKKIETSPENSTDRFAIPTNPTKSSTERPAVRACRRIEKGLTPGLIPHILGGTAAELGEFPHMAAIGYSRIGGDDRPPYDIRCGGTLIDKRFVLTAAHCVSYRESVPSIVRLGVVNFTDVNQMKDAIEIRIKETFIHDDYSLRFAYNDIAILELEHEVQTNDIIYPVCLYTDETDPDTKLKLWVSGWGTINTTTRSFSDVLLKAPLHTSPLERCNQSFGLNSSNKIPEGIIRTLLCAEDKDQLKDACQGDSGGPLQLVVDESYNNYRLVGVVSTGFGCASSTPGLYTRVAAFLDFIEKIVWPNGGD